LFGVRTEIEKLTGIGDLSILSNIQKSFDTGIPEAGAETIDTLETIEEKTLALQETLDETTTQSNKGIIPMIEDVGDCSIKSAKKVDTLSDSIDKLKKKQQTFRLDYVEAETRFQERVARISNKGATDTARNSGLLALVNYQKQVGMEFNFGHDLTSKFTDPMKHWRGIIQKYPKGGNANNAMATQTSYNKSISGYDNNSTKGWSGKALKAQSAFQQRVSRMNALANARHDARKKLGEKTKRMKMEYWIKWGLDGLHGSGKTVMRGMGSLVSQHKKRVKFLREIGYTVNNSGQKAEAEMQYLKDVTTYTDQIKSASHFFDDSHSKETRSLVVSLLEERRRQDIFNIIEHRKRLGLISSGVI
jgi:hypothetical protein